MNVDDYVPNNRTVFVWKLKNYAYHEKLGGYLNSQNFYPSIRGQCCCLVIEWRKDKSIGLFIKFRVGNHEPEEEMMMSVTFSATNRVGLTCKKSMEAQVFKDHKETFIIKPGAMESMARGFFPFLEYPALTDFIIDGVLTIT